MRKKGENGNSTASFTIIIIPHSLFKNISVALIADDENRLKIVLKEIRNLSAGKGARCAVLVRAFIVRDGPL